MALNRNQHHYHGPFTRYVQLRVAHASWMPGMFSSHRLHRKPLVSDPGMQHDMCVTHVPWCMSGSLTRSGGENVPSACATRNFMYLVRGPYRVPQGFALGLFLFTIYILPLGEIIKKIGMQFYMYTEDWHIYMYTILATSDINQSEIFKYKKYLTDDTHAWHSDNMLYLNDLKTERWW